MTTEKTIYTLHIDRHQVQLRRTALGIQVKLERGRIIGAPGSPALPVRMLHVALPTGHKAHAVSARVLSVEPLTRANARVAPFIEIEDDPASRPVGKPSPVLPASPAAEKAFQRGRHRPAWLAGNIRLGEIPIATVLVQAVRYGPDRELELIREIEITVEHAPTASPTVCRPASFTLRKHALARKLVVNPGRVDEHPHPERSPRDVSVRSPERPADQAQPDSPDVGPTRGPAKSPGSGYLPAEIDYLIVTDDRRWNPKGTVEEQKNTEPPDTTPPGSLKTEFERLADSKRARGLKVHTVKLSDIVSGAYGDYATGARDVQEVLRNFLKHVVDKHNVEYVLLGGDSSIVPPRMFCGRLKEEMFEIQLGQGTPPTDDRVPQGYYAWCGGGVMALHIDPTKIKVIEDERPVLTMYHSGLLVPYIADAGGATLRWCYCTDDTYNTVAQTPTQWVRADGLTEDDKPHWYMRLRNLIASDLYYASLFDDDYNQPGKHDWDALDNGLYGQFWSDDDEVVHELDKGNVYSDVHVGRAPVSTVAETAAFVDKVLTYENAPALPDRSRFGQMVIAAINLDAYDYMERKCELVQVSGLRYRRYLDYGPTVELNSHEFVADMQHDFTVLYAKDMYTEYNEQGKLYVYPTDLIKDRKEIPYAENCAPGAGKYSWHFAVDYNHLGVSQQPTHYVVVHSDNPEILVPKGFGYDVDAGNTPTSSVEDSEELYVNMLENLGDEAEIYRLYTDESGLTNAPHLVRRLTDTALLEKLALGPNLFAIAGHGNTNDVANCLYTETASRLPKVSELTNWGKPFIVFARSCLTAAFDVADCLGEELVTVAHVGAVAYVGFSTITANAANDMRNEFFDLSSEPRHLGDIFDGLITSVVPTDGGPRAHLYALTLLGDPEMLVYGNQAALQPYFIGNRRSKELHKSTCLWRERMWIGNEVRFETIDEGLERGYDGCYFCLREHNTG